MKRHPLRITAAFFFILFLAACNLPSGQATPTLGEPVSVATMAAQTFQALTQQPAVTQPTDTTNPAVSATPSLTPTITLTLAPSFTPSLTPTITLTKLPTNTPLPKPGSIEGYISGYPYGAQPSLAIVAFSQTHGGTYSYIITAPGQSYWSMSTDYLLPGPWQVVAYDSSGHSGGCPGTVTVISEQTVSCTISSWGGGYPAKPGGVPNP